MNEPPTAQPFFAVTAQDTLPKSTAPLPAGNQRLAAYVSDLLTKAQRSEMEDACAHATAAAECELYSQAIHRAQGDQSKAATWLGVSRPTMRKKLLRYGVHPRLETVASTGPKGPPQIESGVRVTILSSDVTGDVTPPSWLSESENPPAP